LRYKGASREPFFRIGEHFASRKDLEDLAFEVGDDESIFAPELSALVPIRNRVVRVGKRDTLGLFVARDWTETNFEEFESGDFFETTEHLTNCIFFLEEKTGTFRGSDPDRGGCSTGNLAAALKMDLAGLNYGSGRRHGLDDCIRGLGHGFESRFCGSLEEGLGVNECDDDGARKESTRIDRLQSRGWGMSD